MLVHTHKVTGVVENRHYPSSSTSLPSPVIHSGFIHVKHKAMNEKPCEAERRRGKEEKGFHATKATVTMATI